MEVLFWRHPDTPSYNNGVEGSGLARFFALWAQNDGVYKTV